MTRPTRRALFALLALISLSVGRGQGAVGLVEASDPTLSDDERIAMDVRFFNELAVRQVGWKHKTRQMRYELIVNMGDSGFEPAHLAVRLFDIKPGSWPMRFDAQAYERLTELADAGDPSAQCLAAMATTRWKLKDDGARRYEYIERASQAGQAHCTLLLASMYRDGVHKARSMARWKVLLHRAAKRGDQSAQILLSTGYGRGRLGLPFDLGKAQCWLAVASRADTGESSNFNVRLSIWRMLARKQGLLISLRKYDPDTHCEQELVSE